MDQGESGTSPPLSPQAAHGGRLQEARRLFPRAPEPFIDLSTGINPLPYPLPRLPAEAWSRLPEPEEIAALEGAAAKAYGVRDAGLVVAAPGTQILISLLPRLFPQTSVAILGPTYDEYAHAFAAAGSNITPVSDLDGLRRAEAAVICNPNNPDGRRIDAATMLELLGARAARGLTLVDETFADFDHDTVSIAPQLPVPKIILLRSLSKTYGLGGLRLGFALAAPDLIAQVRGALGPWPVSGPAIAIGAAALADRAWLAAAKGRLEADVRRLDAMLRAAGLKVIGGTLLFRLAEAADAHALFCRLGQAGILVRRFQEHPTWLRFGIPGSEEAWQRLGDALAG